MNLVEKIKQEAGARTISLVMGIVTIALAFLCVGGEGVVPKLFALLFFAAYVFFVVFDITLIVATAKFNVLVYGNTLYYLKLKAFFLTHSLEIFYFLIRPHFANGS